MLSKAIIEAKKSGDATESEVAERHDKYLATEKRLLRFKLTILAITATFKA